MITFAEQLKRLVTEAAAGRHPIIFKLIGDEAVTLHAPFEVGKDHLVRTFSQVRYMLRYEAIAYA